MIHASEMANLWVVRGGSRHHLVPTYLGAGEVGVVYPEFGDGGDINRTSALRLLGVGMDDEPTRAQEAMVASFLAFVRRIEVGDIAVLLDVAAGGAVCGVVTGDYRFRPEIDAARAPHRRTVEWRRRLPFDRLPPQVDDLPSQRTELELVPDGRLRSLALQCCRGDLGDDPLDRPVAASRTASRSARPRARRASPGATVTSRRRAPEREMRRCSVCAVSKSADLFADGSDQCVDCA